MPWYCDNCGRAVTVYTDTYTAGTIRKHYLPTDEDLENPLEDDHEYESVDESSLMCGVCNRHPRWVTDEELRVMPPRVEPPAQPIDVQVINANEPPKPVEVTTEVVKNAYEE